MTLQVAVAGLGHGKSFLRVIEDHPRAELAGVMDTNAEILHEVTAAYDVATFSSLNEMLRAKGLDAAILALPTPLHAETSAACLEEGLHVLQEKPLCRTIEEAKRLSKAIADSGRVFQVGYEVRSSQLHGAIMRHLQQEELGTVTNVWYNQHTQQKRTEAEWRSNRGDMGGKIFDCACHYLNLMEAWAGARCVRLVAFGNVLGKTGPCANELPQTAAIALEYENGVRGTYNFGEENDFEDDASFGIVGTTGRIMGNPFQPEGAGSYELRTDRGARRGTLVFDGDICSRGHLGFAEQVDRFVQTVLDDAPNACPFEAALSTHNTLEAIDRSLASGEVMEVPAPWTPGERG